MTEAQRWGHEFRVTGLHLVPGERQVALELAVAEKLVEDLATRTPGS